MANEERAQITMAALASIANHVANIPGRKNLVWLTAELPFSGTAMARLLSPANIAVYPVDARGLLAQVSSGHLTFTADADQVSGASGHFDNMPAQSSVPIGIPTMQKLAEETGGQAFVNTNDITGAIRKAVEDSAVNYTLGFYIEPNSLDGKFHELKIQVRRPGLSVHYPKGYLALKDAPATQDDRRNNFLIAIKSPLDSSAIPLEVEVDRVNQPTQNSLALSGSIGIHDVQFVQSGEIHTGAIDITVVEQDETGKVLRESANRINLRFSEKQYPAILKTGITFRKSVQPQAGVTTLRILVQDPGTAAIGSLIIPLPGVK